MGSCRCRHGLTLHRAPGTEPGTGGPGREFPDRGNGLGRGYSERRGWLSPRARPRRPGRGDDRLLGESLGTGVSGTHRSRRVRYRDLGRTWRAWFQAGHVRSLRISRALASVLRRSMADKWSKVRSPFCSPFFDDLRRTDGGSSISGCEPGPRVPRDVRIDVVAVRGGQVVPGGPEFGRRPSRSGPCRDVHPLRWGGDATGI
jgi:hypothetical protein